MSAAATTDRVWQGRDTTPAEIEAALAGLLQEIQREAAAGGAAHYVPARVLNLVCVVDEEWSGEIANRLRGVGRYHGSRTIVCSVARGRTTLDATATVSAPDDVAPGELALLRETVVVRCGERHLVQLQTIVDPLVVTDLATCVWSPHGHPEAVDALLELAQVVLTDSADDPDAGAVIARNIELARRAYVVDLAWLRSTPWRERLATTFDPPRLRRELAELDWIEIGHAPDSRIVALLLAGWFSSRLDWRVRALDEAEGALVGTAAAPGGHEVQIRLVARPQLQVRGLDGFELGTATGRRLALGRGRGGLHATYTGPSGVVREWTVLGASRGEPGILGEGIRQALLREPTYGPALRDAATMLGGGRR